MAIVLENYNGARKLIATGAPQQEIDDSVIAPDRMWSSKKLIEISTSQFETTGNPVAVSPFAYSPLGVKINFTPKQSGTGDPSPQNVRPITGYDDVTVNVRGKNLFLFSTKNQSVTRSDITCKYDAETQLFTINGALSSDSAQSILTSTVDYIFPDLRVGDTICVSGNVPDGAYFQINYTSSGITKMLVGTRGKNVATIPDDFERISLAFIGVLPNSVFENSSFHIQLEIGSTPTAYEPYQPGTTAQLTLPETIYGGTVDAVSGVGEKTWEFMEFDGTENWLSYNNSSDVVKTFYVDIGVESYTNYINILCDRASFLFSTWNKDEPWTIGSSSLSNAIYISVPNDVASTVEQWKSYLAAQASAGTPVQVAYKLATPSAFTSDGYKTIQPLEGVNTIYSNTDSVTVSGRTSWINLMEGGN